MIDIEKIQPDMMRLRGRFIVTVQKEDISLPARYNDPRVLCGLDVVN